MSSCQCCHHHALHDHSHDHSHAPHDHGHEHDHEGHSHEHNHEAAAFASPVPASTATRAVYRIPNMDCPMEEALIRNKLGTLPGVTGLEFNLMQRLLTVEHEPGLAPESIESALRAIDMAPAQPDAAPAAPETPRIPWRRICWATALAALAELVELGAEWGHAPATLQTVAEWAAAALSLAAILLAGLGTFRKGWLALINRNLNINALMAVAVTGAFCIGQFPEAAMVMALFNLSEALEARALDRARNAVSDLLALAPQAATVLQPDGAWREVPAAEVAVGSRVRVRPGERVALDGEVCEGHTTINQAPITGESIPVEKGPGDTVYAGTVNEAGAFEFTVTAAARDTTLARIIHAVEEAQATRAPMQRFVDSFARWYTPAVFGLAVLTALVPPLFFGAAWSGSVYMALVLLVIGCPCALVISTPVTVVSGMATAARKGILIKGGAYLEQGRLLDRLALDKTGTLTRGEPVQTDFILLNADGGRGQEVARMAASLATRSDHPVSRAVAAAGKDLALLEMEAVEALPGEGVAGSGAGRRWYLGNYRLMERLGAGSPALLERMAALEAGGKTTVVLASASTDAPGTARAEALFAVADGLRETSVEAVSELRTLGVRTLLLTGDTEATARAMARAAGVDEYRAGLLPQDKLAIVEELERAGAHVGMVGDGINDAPALARADIGFAMAAGGTDTAIETADVALMDDDLRKVPRFIRLSRATHAILVENIAFALGLKAVFFALTFAGMATMWMAVFADVGASLVVVANGLRILRK